MTKFTINEVIDGNTFKVTGSWKWNERNGNTIRASGYITPERGEEKYEETKNKLKRLILKEKVEINNAKIIDDWGRLIADVDYKGQNLADYFHEYKI